MTINIICDGMMKTQHIKKKTNQFLGAGDKEWVNQSCLYDHDILYRLFDHGISLDSLCDTDGMYALVCKYIETVFSDRKIAVYGTYEWDKISQLKGVTITEV